MKKVQKSFCFKAPVIWCLKLAVDCNAALERELSLMQYRPLCAGVIRVSFDEQLASCVCVCVCVCVYVCVCKADR